MLITEQYRQLNEALHKERPGYGTQGVKHEAQVRKLLKRFRLSSVLDYGCGKGSLVKSLPCKGYDPAYPEYAKPPKPADIVVCSDVMEHIEPDCLHDVLTHIKELTKAVAFFAICTRKAKKILADGRNAHLIIQSGEWWRDKLSEYFAHVEPQGALDQEWFNAICYHSQQHYKEKQKASTNA